jgi:hypothetical protein
MDPIIHITKRLLAREIGCTPRWWSRVWASLHDAGVLHRVGRRSFGSLADVRAWLVSQGESQTEGAA